MTIPLPFELLLYPLAAFLVYLPCLNGSLCFDDLLIPAQLEKYKLGKWREYYRPLTTLTFVLQHIWPATRRGWHVGNVLIHSGCGLVVSRLALGLGLSEVVSLLTGLVYVVHPYAVNSVGYITGRASVLSALFGLLGVLAVVENMPLLAVPCVLLAFWAKEDGLGFGVTAILVSVVTGQYWSAGALVLAGLVGLYLRRSMFRELQAGNGDADMRNTGLPVSYAFLDNLSVVFVETVHRIPVWLCGFGSSPYYGSGIPSPSILRLLFGSASLSILLGAILQGNQFAIPAALMLTGPWLVYLVARVPDQLTDYRNYSMVSGFALFWGFVFSAAPQFGIVGLVFVMTFAAMSFRDSWNWTGPEAMWRAAIENTAGDPSRAYQELGVTIKMQGKPLEAEPYFRKAVELNPKLGAALNNLAWCLAETERLGEAIEVMEECTRQCPDFIISWEELGLLYERYGALDKAFDAFTKALTMNPQMLRSANHLGMIHYRKKEFPEALTWFDRLMKVQDVPVFVFNFAMTLKAMGRNAEADQIGAKLNGAAVNPAEIVQEV